MLIQERFADLFGLRTFISDEFQAYQLLTYMFIHSDSGIMHILGNMFGLFMFGPPLENIFGSQRFLAFYVITGLGAGILNSGVNYMMLQDLEADTKVYIEEPDPSRLIGFCDEHLPSWRLRPQVSDLVSGYEANPNDTQYISESKSLVREIYDFKLNIPTVGASGAIFGILIAFAMLFPNIEIMLLFLPIPIKAKYFVGIYVLFELYSGLNYGGASNVAHFAHLGGALIGFLLIKYWGIGRQI